MPHFIEKYFLPKPNPITHEDVEPEEGPQDKEQEVNQVMRELGHAIRNNAARSIAVREQLARKTIHVISRG